jgi:hypothetical protein
MESVRMFKPVFKFKIGDRNGDFTLKKREFLGIVKGKLQVRETWLLDPVVTITPNTTTDKAYDSSEGNTASHYTSPDDATAEFTSAMYTNVQAEDSAYADTQASATLQGRYANVAQKYTFDTSSYSNITDITCIWKGYQDYDGFQVGKLQIYKATAWEDWITSIPYTNTKYSKSIGNGSSYFYDTTWIRFGIYGYTRRISENITICIRTDYAALQITYGVPVVAPKAGLNIPEALAIILGDIC